MFVFVAEMSLLFFNHSTTLCLFKNPHPRMCLLILDREEGRERGQRKSGRERDRDRETDIDMKETWTGCLPYAPTPGIEPTTFWCMG